MGLWKNNPSIDREKENLDKKRLALEEEIRALRNRVESLSQSEPSSPAPQKIEPEEILPLEGHHPFHPRKKDPSPTLRSHQNRDRNLFFLFMGLFIFLILFIIRYLRS